MTLIKSNNHQLLRELEQDLLGFARSYKYSCILDSNALGTELNYDFIAAFSDIGRRIDTSVLNELDGFNISREWTFLSLSYDVKNEIENLTSENYDGSEFPNLSYFHPEVLLISQKGKKTLFITEGGRLKEKVVEDVTSGFSMKLQSRISEEEYISTVNNLKGHIRRGDIYEINFCQEFYQEDAELSPYRLFEILKENAPTPFSSFYKTEHNFLISASPERYIQRKGDRLISQPIKGTIKRGRNQEDDEKLKANLKNSLKEQNENVMIVDLVRNDLSRVSKNSSVKVDELFGIYTFPQVHQMISTISCDIESSQSLKDILEATFPMGSMTGAPKLRAMDLADKYESFKRGIYSGTIGYITPEGDFDLNVVIRSLIYNQKKSYLSYAVGGAITNMCTAEDELKECELKAEAMKLILTKYEESLR